MDPEYALSGTFPRCFVCTDTYTLHIIRVHAFNTTSVHCLRVQTPSDRRGAKSVLCAFIFLSVFGSVHDVNRFEKSLSSTPTYTRRASADLHGNYFKFIKYTCTYTLYGVFHEILYTAS